MGRHSVAPLSLYHQFSVDSVCDIKSSNSSEVTKEVIEKDIHNCVNHHLGADHLRGLWYTRYRLKSNGKLLHLSLSRKYSSAYARSINGYEERHLEI